MKRILSILAVVCLIVCLAVPTLATETYVLSGEWVFNESLSRPSATIQINGAFTYKDGYGDIVTANSLTFGGSTLKYDNEQVYTDLIWLLARYRTITFVEEVQVDVDTYNWFRSNALTDCDGSSCSVADYDVNGICDTCGMTLAYSVQRTYTPNTYPSTLPVLPLGFNDSDDFVVVEVNGVTYLHALVNYGDLDHWDTKASSTSYRATAYGVNGEPVITKYYKYQLVNGDWNQVQSSLTQTTTTFGKFDEVTFIYSTIDIKDSDGNIFFPVPLWMEMDRVTQGEMTQTTETVVGTMTTLVLCGVGCLALLVVLKLLGKRSLIFRN